MTKKVTRVCDGDIVDGLEIDLIEFSGITTLTEEQEDKLWSQATDIQLVERCVECELVFTGEKDDVPSQSTEFFKLVTDNIEGFKEELRNEIWDVIND